MGSGARGRNLDEHELILANGVLISFYPPNLNIYLKLLGFCAK